LVIDTNSLEATDGGASTDGAASVPCTVRTGTIEQPDLEWPEPIMGAWGNSDSWLGGLSGDNKLLALHKFDSQTLSDVYVSRGTDFGFGVPMLLVQTNDKEWPVFVERDGEDVWFVREEPNGNTDAFRINVESGDIAPFDLNSATTNEDALWRSGDGNRIYCTVDGIVTRANRENADASCVIVADYGAALGTVEQLTLSCDEREIFYTVGGAHHELFWATREDLLDNWTTPYRVPINTGNDEANPTLSVDGQTLYLNHNTKLDGSLSGPALIKAAVRK
jgi:hypothetical protein